MSTRFIENNTDLAVSKGSAHNISCGALVVSLATAYAFCVLYPETPGLKKMIRLKAIREIRRATDSIEQLDNL